MGERKTSGQWNEPPSKAVDAMVRELVRKYAGGPGSVAEWLCDRHDPKRNALRYEDASGRREVYTYDELANLSRRFAAVLKGLGVDKGDRVAVLLPKSAALVIALLGIWRIGAVHVPLFTAFGPQAIWYRICNSGARVVVTDHGQRPKLDGAAYPASEGDDQAGRVDVADVRIVTADGAQAGDVSFWDAVHAANPLAERVSMNPDDLFILLYTSGTTGQPKGVEVPVRALAAFEAYMRFGLDLRDDDVFWNIADPGWAYGLYYGVVGPLLLGQAPLLVNAPFAVERTYRVLSEYGVTNFTAAPTVYRSLRASSGRLGELPPLRLRVLSSAGEPLNADVVAWARENFGLPIHDHYGQTEQGMVVNNHHHPALRRALRAGSMGQSMPGFRVAVVDPQGEELAPGKAGEVAVDTVHSPLFWFRGYFGDPEWTRQRFSADRRWYFTGDAGSMDEDGYLYFSGRADDIITSAGYRIGPFEVESALMGHPAVAEAAAIGVPDERRGEVVKAFVVLRPGYSPSDALAEELQQFVKRGLSAHAYPRAIAFVEELPKTPSGKVQRYLLRANRAAE
ncbi:AMP-binding protein [Alicyclobacillus sp.]|uniref:AMP-binding protein n=1 Tax=Alicyclobacillus sp. TaxID=61169 RepID=UPI0025C345FD|nr:AMP-binding protein [Alicyclobacillus sp.]MCL6517885.1 AMP-binding protein [Alicyclobacillus sp.]